jgi:serine protease Do
MDIGEIGERLRRSTVHIRGAGSGIVWDAEGTIVTNAHVLRQGAHWVDLRVDLWDGRSFPAEIKARDDHMDLAKLKLAAAGLPAAVFRQNSVRPGEFVVAVGNPLGFTGALSTGCVHAAGPFPGLGRRRWVQAAIRLAPGNSGGPLADAAGQVVGINTMVVSGGLALAIPGAVVEEFVRSGPSSRLGVTVQPVRLNGRDRLGLVILSIDSQSPAEQASLLIGDVILGSAVDLADAIQAGGGSLKVRFLRGDRSREREVAISLAGRLRREAA